METMLNIKVCDNWQNIPSTTNIVKINARHIENSNCLFEFYVIHVSSFSNIPTVCISN